MSNESQTGVGGPGVTARHAMGTRPASRRRTSEAYRVRREAILVARPFNEMIGGWQARIARLRTLTDTRRAMSTAVAALAEIQALLEGDPH